ncbi:hypothetical protein GZH47_20230 [Paenibacillus rhizovicinus]|uniref:Uncharacterized protein n=1 Tax=Paenibacillus rhizovicinus TaxID=2704463 RepID=A0A6C0P353_9BACL|nr:hypothetical protein [Paenibacillus rhizovicinus]QHW32909.1 hypothetical protein GZH47_20230 [Paenibacillus rhizovicinus]
MKRKKNLMLVAAFLMAAGAALAYPTFMQDANVRQDQEDHGVATSSVHVNQGASIDAAPIDLTFSKAEVSIMDELNESNYRALYIDNETYVRVAKEGSIQVSKDRGTVWTNYDTEVVSAPYFTDWLERNDPNPDGNARRGMLAMVNGGAEIRHAVFPNGKEMFVVIDDASVQIELCTPTKLNGVLIDGQKLMVTFRHAMHASTQTLQAFYDLLVSNGILTPAEAEQDYKERIERMEDGNFI